MHGSIAPTRVLISLEFDSHLSGVNQDKISAKKFKTAHNGFPREGKGVSFFPLILSAFSSDSPDLTHTTDRASVLGSGVRNRTQTHCAPIELPRMGSFSQTMGNAFHTFLDHCANLNARLGNGSGGTIAHADSSADGNFLGPLHPHLTQSRDLSALTRSTTAIGTKGERDHC